MRHMMRWMVGGALLVCACSKPNDAKQGMAASDSLPPGHVPIDQPASAGPKLTAAGQAYVDSGNTAFRVKDFKGALAYYRKATESDPTHAAPWFGAYMVGQATSDKGLADSALAEVKKRAPQMDAHPGGTPGMPNPAGAPPAGEPSPYSPHGGTVAPTRKS